MKKRLVKLIPPFLKPTLEKLYYFSIDIVDNLKGKDSMVPPRSKIFVGAGDFVKNGEEFKKYFVDLGNLKPSDRVLDVGCGIGRMAIPLTSHLSKEGEYWGFDIVKSGIEWCQSRITPKFSNFHFQHSDVYNQHYNPSGKVRAQNYKFPFDDESFDFCFLTSVFTHMLPSDLDNYLSEITRVLRPKGNCLVTFFLLNDESERLIASGRSTLDFSHEMQGYKTTDANDPEAAVAYSEDSILELFEKHHLKIAQPIKYGAWCKRDTYLSYQDILIATKSHIN